MVCTIPMERTSVPYLLEGMERAWFHTYGTGLVPYPGTHESPGVCTIPFEKNRCRHLFMDSLEISLDWIVALRLVAAVTVAIPVGP